MAYRTSNGMTSLLVTVGVAAALVGVVFTYRVLAAPYYEAAILAEQNRKLAQKAFVEAKKANDAERQTEYLRTSAGLEWLARENGKVKPGEKPLVDP
jgi:hypothetical protein